MVRVTFGIRRLEEKAYDEKKDMIHHLDRAKLVNQLVSDKNIEVVKDEGWESMNDMRRTREYVELVMVLGSAGVFTAVVSAFKAWLEQRKLREVRMKLADGSEITAQNATVKQFNDLVKAAKG